MCRWQWLQRTSYLRRRSMADVRPQNKPALWRLTAWPVVGSSNILGAHKTGLVWLCESIPIEPPSSHCPYHAHSRSLRLILKTAKKKLARFAAGLFDYSWFVERSVERFTGSAIKTRGFEPKGRQLYGAGPEMCLFKPYKQGVWGFFERGKRHGGGVPVPCTTQYYFWDFNTVKRRGDLGYDWIGYLKPVKTIPCDQIYKV